VGRGKLQARQSMPGQPGSRLSRLTRTRQLLPAGDFIGKQVGPAFALDRILLAAPAAEHIPVPVDLVRQSTVDERRGLKSESLVPGSVVEFEFEDFLQTALGEIVCPVLHQVSYRLNAEKASGFSLI
jgi:hypothetical protein